MKCASLLLVLGCLGSLLACGDLGDDDDAPLAVIEGQLTSQSALSTAPSTVRVAVVWSTGTTGFKASMDIPASPVFPSQFRLELRDPPPASAMASSTPSRPTDPTTDNPTSVDPPSATSSLSRPLTNQPPSYSYAIGSVVAYEDLDGDGRLGLIDVGTPPTDRVLGTNEELLVVYFEGDTSGVVPPPPTRGYNLLRSPRCTRPRRGEPVVCPPVSWLPSTTLYELPLTADPQLAEQMCRSADGQVSAGSSRIHEPAPAPGSKGWPDRDDPNLLCSPDGKSYDYFECVEGSLGLCKGTFEECDQYKWTMPSATPPPEWPCTVK